MFRAAITKIRSDYPFKIDAFVLLPDHLHYLHCICTLPEHDADYAIRWRLIKTYVSKSYGESLNPVKHGLCDAPEDWPYSSFHQFVAHGIYEKGWGSSVVIPNLAYDI